MYETKISSARWILYDSPGNITKIHGLNGSSLLVRRT